MGALSKLASGAIVAGYAFAGGLAGLFGAGCSMVSALCGMALGRLGGRWIGPSAENESPRSPCCATRLARLLRGMADGSRGMVAGAVGLAVLAGIGLWESCRAAGEPGSGGADGVQLIVPILVLGER
eukprot:evm.model.scf_2169.1 EVM.evm.TU.scf_2169.1   scf_2169:24495-24874(-)